MNWKIVFVLLSICFVTASYGQLNTDCKSLDDEAKFWCEEYWNLVSALQSANIPKLEKGSYTQVTCWEFDDPANRMFVEHSSQMRVLVRDPDDERYGFSNMECKGQVCTSIPNQSRQLIIESPTSFSFRDGPKGHHNTWECLFVLDSDPS